MRFFGGARVTRHIVTVQDGKYTVQDGKTWRMSHVYVAVAWFPLWCLSTSTTLWQADDRDVLTGYSSGNTIQRARASSRSELIHLTLTPNAFLRSMIHSSSWTFLEASFNGHESYRCLHVPAEFLPTCTVCASL
ncbi:uncharacterized protein LOC111254091 [Varroa destructor]|uniref:Uncharacterized protein n=1 Tax=Varroa destructor TaxID=109461 RepID=A0A7M7L4U6_VARDE|nr:uncharacterized protein LOC111254091 [Varroa destructor]